MFSLFSKNEIITSTEDSIKSRMSNSVYGHLLIFWSILHWQVLYISVFVSEEKLFEKTGYLKHEYILNLISNPSPSNIILWIIPFVLTWFAIWIAPKWIFIPAFEKEEETREQKMSIQFKVERKISEEKIKLLNQQEKEIEEEGEKIKKETKIKSENPQLVWDEEFEQFKKYYGERYIIFVQQWYSGNKRVSSHIPSEIAYFDSLGLIELSDSGDHVKSLSDKGKYFFKKIDNKIP